MSGLKRTTFIKVFTDFGVLFDKPVSKAKMDILWDSFSSWDDDKFIFVANSLKKTCRFMPAIVDFYECEAFKSYIDPKQNKKMMDLIARMSVDGQATKDEMGVK